MGGFLLKVRRSHGDPNIVAMLSLYLLLLAFFILLNALSKLEDDRTRTVLKSVNEAFNGHVQSPDSIRKYPAALGMLDQSGGLLSDIQKLFEAAIPATETELSDNGAMMRVTFASEGLFRPGRPELRAGRKALLKKFADILMTERKDGMLFELEWMHGVPEDKAGIVAEAGPRSLEVRRMGLLVGAFETFGLPSSQLSVGIAPGHPNEVQLLIRVFEKPAAPMQLEPVRSEPRAGPSAGRGGAEGAHAKDAEPTAGATGNAR